MEKEKYPISVPDAELMQLADKIVAVVEEGKQRLAISINQTVKSTYWNVGRHIVEFEQQGHARAKYGTNLLSRLAKILKARVGRGYSHPNLNNMRKFYLMFPNFQMSEKLGTGIYQTSENCETMSHKLKWSHISEYLQGRTVGGICHLRRMDSNLFVSKYELFLPNKEELRKMVKAILK